MPKEPRVRPETPHAPKEISQRIARSLEIMGGSAAGGYSLSYDAVAIMHSRKRRDRCDPLPLDDPFVMNPPRRRILSPDRIIVDGVPNIPPPRQKYGDEDRTSTPYVGKDNDVRRRPRALIVEENFALMRKVGHP